MLNQNTFNISGRAERSQRQCIGGVDNTSRLISLIK